MFKPRGLVLLLAMLMLVSISFAVTDEEKAQAVLQKAADRLGWSDTVYPAEDSSVGRQFFIAGDDQGEDSDLKASIVVLDTDLEAPFYLGFFESQLMFNRGNYQGRDAVFTTPGENCNPTGLVKVIADVIYDIFGGIFGGEDTGERCVTFYDNRIWSCGKYMFLASDETEDGGQGDDIAAALYASAEDEHLCDYGDTLVILAESADKPGDTLISDFVLKTQKINEYYAANSYGKQSFSYTFKDADGSEGDNDWYIVGPSQTTMSKPQYFEAAVKKAFDGTDIAQDLRFKRIVVVYSGAAKQDDPSGVYSTADSWKADDYNVEVTGGNGNKYKIYTTDAIMVSENDTVGDWSHELSHSVWWKYKTDGTTYKINDRYNYADPALQYGEVGAWDLMGDGNYWGNPKGTAPTQMSTYTKEGAGWLAYAAMERNKSYADKALEAKTAGATALMFDDPESADPNFFYVVEARDSTLSYGAPESGVVLYKVGYDSGNKHEIVNNLEPQDGTRTSASNGRVFVRPTLNLGVNNYTSVPGKFRLVLERSSASPYTANVRLEDYTPRNMTGAIVAPNLTALLEMFMLPGESELDVKKNKEGPKPDIDLHAYDENGAHVGLDYSTGEYENEIPGAIASGDLQDDSEWIFVPSGTQVRYEVSAYKTQQYLAANPEYAAYAKPQGFSTTLVKIDSQGNQMSADGGAGSVSAGQKTSIKSPDDTTLVYTSKPYPGFGNNGCLPFFVFLGLVGAAAFFARDNDAN